MKPKMILLTPMVRTKNTRGLLPLQILQRMKLGCDCPRKAVSATQAAEASAEGCVVCWRAWRQMARSLCERLSSRGAVKAR